MMTIIKRVHVPKTKQMLALFTETHYSQKTSQTLYINFSLENCLVSFITVGNVTLIFFPQTLTSITRDNIQVKTFAVSPYQYISTLVLNLSLFQSQSIIKIHSRLQHTHQNPLIQFKLPTCIPITTNFHKSLSNLSQSKPRVLKIQKHYYSIEPELSLFKKGMLYTCCDLNLLPQESNLNTCASHTVYCAEIYLQLG